MKKFNITGLLLLMLLAFTGCKEDTFTLTSELPQFETKEGLMLLEVLVPVGTGVNDNIYIYGDFNGGEEAVGNPQWQLQRASTVSGVPAKFGIYLDPTTFQDGKTLADGYTFYNIQNGPEVDKEGNGPVWHYDYPAPGQRLNVFVDYFEGTLANPDDEIEVEHDGYAIFVINNTGWTELALYAWGDAEPFGGWPGIQVTGRQQIDGVMYQYFDTGADNEGLNLNLIFNNNNNDLQLPDVNVTLNKDYYFELTAEGAVEIDPNENIEHDGYTVYVYNNTGWDALALYMWGEVNDLNGGWPGMQPTGTIVINGIGYVYFDLGEANTGLNENLIFNNNKSENGEQAPDYNFTINEDLYVEVTAKSVTKIDPETFKPGETPETPPTPANTYTLYVEDNTGWTDFYVYAFGAHDTDYVFGAYPGEKGEETVEIKGVTYYVFEFANGGEIINLIFNDGNGKQYIAGAMTAEQDYYFNATPTSAIQLSAPSYSIFIDNQTGWSNFYIYGYTAGYPELFGAWPGKTSTVTQTINGIEYLVFEVEASGLTYNLIFHPNIAGTQYDACSITLDQDYYITAYPKEAIINKE